MKQGNWIAIDKNIKNYFKQPYSKGDALISFAIDADKNKTKSIREYSKIWDWSKTKTGNFIGEINRDKKRPLSGTGLRLIIKDLRCDDGTKKGQKKTTYYNNNKELYTREADFKEEINQYLNNPYSDDLLNAFLNYWTEPNKSKTKMRFELQKTWDLKRRLNTWNNNSFKSKEKLTPGQAQMKLTGGLVY